MPRSPHVRSDWIVEVVRHVQLLAAQVPFCSGAAASKRIEIALAGLGPPSGPLEFTLLNGFRAQLILRAATRLGTRDARAPSRGRAAGGRDAAAEAKTYIDGHIGFRLTVADVGRHVGRRPRWLDRQFRLYWGCSVHEYVTRVQVDRLRVLLATERCKNESISRDIGFKAKSSFYRFTRRHFGLSPGSLAAAATSGPGSK